VLAGPISGSERRRGSWVEWPRAGDFRPPSQIRLCLSLWSVGPNADGDLRGPRPPTPKLPAVGSRTEAGKGAREPAGPSMTMPNTAGGEGVEHPAVHANQQGGT